MFSTPFLSASLAATVALFAAPGPINAVPVNGKVEEKEPDHLDKAAHELKHAHTALSGNGGNAQQHLSEAISHIEHAMKSPQGSGLGGAVNTAVHRHQLHEALHAAKEAQKHLASGKVHEAKREAEKAHKHVETALRHPV